MFSYGNVIHVFSNGDNKGGDCTSFDFVDVT